MTLSCALWLAVSLPIAAQEPPTAPRPSAVSETIAVRLVELGLLARDRDGRPVGVSRSSNPSHRRIDPTYLTSSCSSGLRAARRDLPSQRQPGVCATSSIELFLDGVPTYPKPSPSEVRDNHKLATLVAGTGDYDNAWYLFEMAQQSARDCRTRCPPPGTRCGHPPRLGRCAASGGP